MCLMASGFQRGLASLPRQSRQLVKLPGPSVGMLSLVAFVGRTPPL